MNNTAESTEYFKPYKVYNIDKIASDYSFHDIGTGSTIINKSLVQGSFNKVEREYGGDVKQTLDQIS